MAEANQVKTIGDLLTRDLSRKIEEIIQVDQADVQSVHDEITEYIATDSIREQYHDLLKAVAEAPNDPNESVGVWVSGFFGSGKSSFAKNLGYALENRVLSAKLRRGVWWWGSLEEVALRDPVVPVSDGFIR
jgi:hypothetical protein